MAVDKTLLSELRLPAPSEEDVEVEFDETIDGLSPDIVIIEGEDGTVTVDFAPQEGIMFAEDRHDSNLAEYIDESALRHCASKLVQMFEDDKASRSDWERTYEEGLDLLGLEMEDRTTPWPGACGVFHPLLSESVVRFQAQTRNISSKRSGKNKDLGREHAGGDTAGASRAGVHELPAS